MTREIKVVLAGNPNSGKTSLFNALTGLNHKVSNIAGTTVEKKTGYCRLDDSTRARIVDLPGTYSLYPKAADEAVAYAMLVKEDIDVVLFIADASNLKRNLLLLTQIADTGLPVVLVLNMLDVAERRGIFYDIEVLAKCLRISVTGINARNKTGINRLKEILKNQHKAIPPYFDTSFVDVALLNDLKQKINRATDYAVIQYAVNSSHLRENSVDYDPVFKLHVFNPTLFKQQEILERYRLIDEAVRTSRKEKTTEKNRSFSNKADKILTHKIWGLLIFIAILFIMFQAIFAWSEYPMNWVENGFSWIGRFVGSILPEGILNDLVVNGILAGLSGVIVFLPQIVILFAFIAFLEDIGYMARVGFMMDRIMRPFGMNGRSIVPLISGMACAVPSIMAARSIENRKERLITILVTPFMSCSARLPVYTLLISLMVADDATLGPFNLHGVILMAMYLLGFIAALISAAIFKFFIKAKEASWFIMELPGYKMPVFHNMMITLYHKASAFVLGAGKIIVAVSIILWGLASFGPGESLEKIESRYANRELNDSLSAHMNAEKLQASYAGRFGKMIEPAIRPLGYDWKIGIALITSLAAREVFVGTMSTIYSVGGGDDENSIQSIRQKMAVETDVHGNKTYSMATILSLMVFYAFAMQCISTVSVVHSETQSWKWALIQLVYMTGLAYLAAWFVYRLFS